MCSQKLHLGTPKLEAMATSHFSHVAWYWIRSVCCPWCMQVSHNWTQKCPKPVNQHQNLQSLFNRFIQNSTWTFFKANLCVVSHLSSPKKMVYGETTIPHYPMESTQQRFPYSHVSHVRVSEVSGCPPANVEDAPCPADPWDWHRHDGNTCPPETTVVSMDSFKETVKL